MTDSQDPRHQVEQDEWNTISDTAAAREFDRLARLARKKSFPEDENQALLFVQRFEDVLGDRMAAIRRPGSGKSRVVHHDKADGARQ